MEDREDDSFCIRPYNAKKFLEGNLYKNINKCIKESKLLESARLYDLNNKMSDWLDYCCQFNAKNGTKSMINVEEQSRIAQYYEKLPKEINIAIKKFENNEIEDSEKKNENIDTV